MINYIKLSLKRKRARRVTQEYPHTISRFELEREGLVEFANWDNPLLTPVEITQPEIDFYRKFIKKGDVVIDIGANIGDTTVPMAIAAGKEGVTFGFDPNPFVFKILEVNATLNRDKAHIIPVLNAITVQEEEFYYISSEASFANGGISPTRESIHGKYIYPEKIKGVNLLEFFNRNHQKLLDRLTFIKVDTEGYDKEILKSISDLISRYKPVLVAESFGKSTDEAKKELFEVIHSYGYRLFYFADFREGTPTEEIKTAEDMIRWKDTINLYAIPVERAEERK
jgi:FkbM family methyltransferase